MSFSREVKEELIGRMPSQAHCRRAELCGFLVYRGELLPDGTLEFVCDNQGIAKKVFTLFRKNYKMIPDVTVSGHGRSRHIKISLGAEKALQAVLKDLAPDNELPGGGI